MHEEGVRPLPVVPMLCLFSFKYDADVLAHPTTRDFDYHFEDFGYNLSFIFHGTGCVCFDKQCGDEFVLLIQ